MIDWYDMNSVNSTAEINEQTWSFWQITYVSNISHVDIDKELEIISSLFIIK